MRGIMRGKFSLWLAASESLFRIANTSHTSNVLRHSHLEDICIHTASKHRRRLLLPKSQMF